MGVFVEPSGRAPTPRALLLRGLVGVAVVAALLFALFVHASSQFDRSLRLDVEITGARTGVAPGVEVKYRGLAVGTVESLEPLNGATRPGQRMHLLLDAERFDTLPANLGVGFAAANVFGASAVELQEPTVPRGALVDGDVIRIDSTHARDASIAALLSGISSLTGVADSSTTHELVELLEKHTPTLSRSLAAGLAFARVLADEQQRPLSHYLRIVAATMPGVAEVTPGVISAVDRMVGESAYLDAESNQVHTAITGVSHFVWRIGDLLKNTYPDLLAIIDPVLDLIVPLVDSAATISQGYESVGTLLARVDKALVPNGTGLSIDATVVLANAPTLLTSLGLPGDAP
ncbi:hypothetical protein NOU13_24480 [Rhodococcus erythropolis]|uniref:MlaD family protein n=1 Tax=Rhodococcus erythropolis TaxID=1833 RepID=UPI00210AB2E5|nr:MlaD family protein [Rhodococcus erythropolis]MCQ4127661.1 hypothetical protein [Rhodococcus erythropolis]